jgi:hypothetical protein
MQQKRAAAQSRRLRLHEPENELRRNGSIDGGAAFRHHCAARLRRGTARRCDHVQFGSRQSTVDADRRRFGLEQLPLRK